MTTDDPQQEKLEQKDEREMGHVELIRYARSNNLIPEDELPDDELNEIGGLRNDEPLPWCQMCDEPIDGSICRAGFRYLSQKVTSLLKEHGRPCCPNCGEWIEGTATMPDLDREQVVMPVSEDAPEPIEYELILVWTPCQCPVPDDESRAILCDHPDKMTTPGRRVQVIEGCT